MVEVQWNSWLRRPDWRRDWGHHPSKDAGHSEWSFNSLNEYLLTIYNGPGRGLFWCRESMDIKAKSAIICYGKKMSPRSHRDMRKWAGAQAHPALRYLPSAGLSELFCCNRPVFIKDGVGFPSSVWLLENRSKTLFLHGELSRRGLAKGNR